MFEQTYLIDASWSCKTVQSYGLEGTTLIHASRSNAKVEVVGDVGESLTVPHLWTPTLKSITSSCKDGLVVRHVHVAHANEECQATVCPGR